MRKNVKQQLALRVLSTAALMAMVSSIATAAFAAEYDVTKGSVDILAADGEQRITQWEDKSKGTYVTDDKGEIKDRLDDDITLTTKDKTTGETKTTSNTVTIDAKEGNTANVTLQDVHIETEGSWNNTGSAAIEIKGNGNGRLDAVSNAIKENLGIQYRDLTYTEHALEQGSKSRAAAYLGITGKDGRITWGVGVDSDIITASVKALFSAINRQERKRD